MRAAHARSARSSVRCRSSGAWVPSSLALVRTAERRPRTIPPPAPTRIPMYRRLAVAFVALAIVAPTLAAQTVPAPREHFGFEIGADRRLANWDALTAYFERLAQTSPRVTVDTLGFATAGSPFVMLTITSPENHARLDELRAIQDQDTSRRVESSCS